MTTYNPNTSTITVNTTTIPVTYRTGSTVGGWTVGAVGAGGSGAVLTSTGSNGSSWISHSSAFSSSNSKTIMSIPYGEEKVVLEEKATLEVKGTLKINGIDLEERLKIIERVLAIPERDATMEAKYPSLKKKFDEYINTLEKYRTFERIKGENE